MRSLTIAALAAAAITTAPAAARDREPPAATPIGAPASCVPVNQIGETRVHNDRVIDFHMRGKRVYRNVLPYNCPSLGFERAITYKTSTNRLCSVDIIGVLRTSPRLERGASCGLGQFQPVELAKRVRRGQPG